MPAKLATAVFAVIRALFRLRIGRAARYARRDRIMAVYAPLSLLTLAAVWLVNVGVGFSAMYWALGVRPLREAIALSGSSLVLDAASLRAAALEGRRVNYDTVLVTLASFVMAPYAPWSSDRSAAFFRPPVLRCPRSPGR